MLDIAKKGAPSLVKVQFWDHSHLSPKATRPMTNMLLHILERKPTPPIRQMNLWRFTHQPIEGREIMEKLRESNLSNFKSFDLREVPTWFKNEETIQNLEAVLSRQQAMRELYLN